jgi:hypothetical protein
MGAHHRVLRGWVLLLLLRQLLLVHEDAEGTGEIVHRAQAIQRGAQVVIQAFVRGVHVAEERIAADRRYLTGQQHRSQ